MATDVLDGALLDCGPEPRPSAPVGFGPWTLPDLLDVDPRSQVLLDSLRHLHWVACKLLEDVLARPSLALTMLQRLEASLMRQVSDARELEQRLMSAEAYGDALDEAKSFRVYLERTLERVSKRQREGN